MDAQLLLDEGTLPAAGQQGDSGGVSGDLQGEGFGDGDGPQQVLHPQQGALCRIYCSCCTVGIVLWTQGGREHER